MATPPAGMACHPCCPHRPHSSLRRTAALYAARACAPGHCRDGDVPARASAAPPCRGHTAGLAPHALQIQKSAAALHSGGTPRRGGACLRSLKLPQLAGAPAGRAVPAHPSSPQRPLRSPANNMAAVQPSIAQLKSAGEFAGATTLQVRRGPPPACRALEAAPGAPPIAPVVPGLKCPARRPPAALPAARRRHRCAGGRQPGADAGRQDPLRAHGRQGEHCGCAWRRGWVPAMGRRRAAALRAAVRWPTVPHAAPRPPRPAQACSRRSAPSSLAPRCRAARW